MLEMIKTSSRRYDLESHPHLPRWAPPQLKQNPTALDHIVSAGPSNPLLPCLTWRAGMMVVVAWWAAKDTCTRSVEGEGVLCRRDCLATGSGPRRRGDPFPLSR